MATLWIAWPSCFVWNLINLPKIFIGFFFFWNQTVRNVLVYLIWMFCFWFANFFELSVWFVFLTFYLGEVLVLDYFKFRENIQKLNLKSVWRLIHLWILYFSRSLANLRSRFSAKSKIFWLSTPFPHVSFLFEVWKMSFGT